MVMYRAITLYGDGELIEIAKSKGINLSHLFNDSLKQALEMPDNPKNDSLELQEHIKKIQTEKALLNQQLETATLELKKLQEERQKEQEERQKRIAYSVNI